MDIRKRPNPFRILWYKFRNFFHFLLKKPTMLLPTIKNPTPPPTDLVDNGKIPYVFIWTDKNGKKYIGLVLDGHLYKLAWSLELEYWLSISGVFFVWIPEPPYGLEFSLLDKVSNIPADLPDPIQNNHQNSKPAI